MQGRCPLGTNRIGVRNEKDRCPSGRLRRRGEAEEGKQSISVILQNAETVRLVQPNGKAIPLVDLEEGSEVLTRKEEGGRHFWVKIVESIIER